MSALSASLSTSVGRRRKFGEASCMECTGQGNDFKLIPTVKIETINPIERYFGSEFPAICNHCRVMTAWSRKTLNILEKFLSFLEKRPLAVKFSKFCFIKFGRWEIGEIVRCLPDKKNKISPGSAAVATLRIAHKIFQGQPPTVYSECSKFHPNTIHFWRSYSQTREHRQNAP